MEALSEAHGRCDKASTAATESLAPASHSELLQKHDEFDEETEENVEKHSNEYMKDIENNDQKAEIDEDNLRTKYVGNADNPSNQFSPTEEGNGLSVLDARDERKEQRQIGDVQANENVVIPEEAQTACNQNINRDDKGESEQATISSSSNSCCWFLWWNQFWALIRKNFLLKRRTPFATLLEILTPVLMMLILASARSLAEVYDIHSATYEELNLNFPGQWLRLWNAATDLNDQQKQQPITAESGAGMMDRRLLTPDTQRWKHWPEPADIFDLVYKHQNHFREAAPSHFRRLQDGIAYDEESDTTNGTDQSVTSQYSNAYEILSDARQQLNSLLKDPLPIPTFGQYVRTSRAIGNALNISSLPRVLSDNSYGRSFGNLLTLGTLHLSPVPPLSNSSNNRALQFWKFLNETYPDVMIRENATNGTEPLFIRTHGSEKDAVKYIDIHSDEERAWALIDFTSWTVNDQSSSSSPKDSDTFYKIRMNYTTLPNTAQITDFVTIGLNPRYKRYYMSGYLTLQRTLNEFDFAQEDAKSGSQMCMNTFPGYNGTTDVWSMPMPTAQYSQNTFYLSVGYLLGLTIVMAYLYPFARLIKNLVEEKESKMKEVLLIAGIYESAHWCSWLVSAIVMFLLVATLVSWSLSINVMHHSNSFYLFTWIAFFSTSSVGLCFTVSALFSRAKLAAIIGPIALFATVLPRYLFFGFNRYEATVGKQWASLLPATAFAFGADIIADYEYAEQGIQSWNVNEGKYSFGTSIGFLLFDTILYIILGWYLEQVIPRQYGTARPWYFIFSPWFWCHTLLSKGQGRDFDRSEAGNFLDQENHEPIAEYAGTPWVSAKGLTKCYKKNATAVKDLSFIFYENQITALLGHNGAGKSTFIGMLTGLLTPTHGDCIIGNFSMVEDTSRARQTIGFCPQENILFDRLTVVEHLRLFFRLRGRCPRMSEILRLAEDVGLSDFVHVRSQALSGGNKRKLCLAVALSGGDKQKFLVLDEPTSGMDPASRRACWECLRKERFGRVILLVSHTMSEADLLADRVAIMKDGMLQASGSPLFLKDRFDLGYNLTLVLETKVDGDNDISKMEKGEKMHASGGIEVKEKSEKLLVFLEKSIPGTKLLRSFGREVTFRLPKGQENFFPVAFEALESNKEVYGVGAYGIENSSLEEVFLLLAEDNAEASTSSDTREARPVNTAEGVSEKDGAPLEVPPLVKQVKLMYWKRYTIQKRDLSGVFFSIIVPVLLIALVLLILTIDVNFTGPSIELSPATIYDASASGESVISDVLTGGGSDIEHQESYLGIASFLRSLYDKLNFEHNNDVSTSADMSAYLLRTINDNNHSTRYGAFVFEDELRATALVEWETLKKDSGALFNSSEFQKFVYSQTSDSVTARFSSFLKAAEASVPSIFNDTTQSSQLLTLAPLIITQIVSGGLPLESLLDFMPNETSKYDIKISSQASILHNASSPHAIAAFNQAYMEYLFHSCSGGRLSSSVNHPLPMTTEQALEIKVILSVLTSMFLLIPFCLIPGAFVVFLVKERACKAKHLQLVSGVKMSAYWIGSYLWDLSVFGVLSVLIMIIFLFYGKDSAQVFVGDAESFFCTMALIFGFGLSTLPFSYIIARKFSNHSSAQIAVIGTVFITGFVFVNAVFIMKSLEKTEHIAAALDPAFKLFPAYIFGDGLMKLSSSFLEREILGQDKQPFDYNVVGKPLAILYGVCIPYLIILLVLEDAIAETALGRFFRSIRVSLEELLRRWHGVRIEGDQIAVNGMSPKMDYVEDNDVQQERSFVLQNSDQMKATSPIIFRNVWKIYLPPSKGVAGMIRRFANFFFRLLCCCLKQSRWKESNRGQRVETDEVRPKCAVRGLTFSVRKGETFVLLGPNGCGKSTSIGILSGDNSPTHGDVFIAGHKVSGKDFEGVKEARKKIGLCPQVDPLLERMTGRETLSFFAKIRGFPPETVDAVVEKLLEQLTLTPHADKTTETYSGGNKRKLSLGIALIGKPTVLLIDESSSGVDPVAARHIWDLISEISEGRSVILTTHSMDEAQALSTKTGVMAAGQLLCLGSVQHLKSRFLNGYTVDIYLDDSSNNHENSDFISEMEEIVLPGSKLLEQQGRFFRFELSGVSAMRLSNTFGRLEELKRSRSHWKVENYAIKQCSLEQVFVKLVAGKGEDGKSSCAES